MQVFLSQSRLGDVSFSDSSSFHLGAPQCSKSLESSQFSYKLGTKNGESLTGGGPSLELPRICQQSIGQNSVPWPHLPARKAGDVMQLCFGENEKWFHSGQSLTQITRHFTTNSRFVLHFCDFQCQQIFLFFNNFDAGYSQHFHHPTPNSAGLLQKTERKLLGCQGVHPTLTNW